MSKFNNTSASNHPFSVWITPECHLKLNLYAQAALPNEIGGLAKLYIEGRDVFVTDVRMLRQAASGATFEIDSDVIAEFTREEVKAGRADELQHWCSIVHSHPVGMGPNMSSVDVEAIQRFAEEEDAFSLIITACPQGKSNRLLMHYCANVRGSKLIVRDMPVHVAVSGQRLDLANKLNDLIVSELGEETVGEQREAIEKAVRTLVSTGLPQSFDAERELLKQLISEEMPSLQPPAPAATELVPMSHNTVHPYESWLIDEWEKDNSDASFGRYVSQTDRQDEWEDIQDWMSIANGTDPSRPSVEVQPARRQKAAHIVSRRLIDFNEELLEDYGVQIGDMAIVNDEKFTGRLDDNDMLTTPRRIVDMHENRFHCSFVLEGSREMFYPEELVIISRWEPPADDQASEGGDGDDDDAASAAHNNDQTSTVAS